VTEECKNQRLKIKIAESSTKIELSQSLFSNENYPVKDAYFGAG